MLNTKFKIGLFVILFVGTLWMTTSVVISKNDGSQAGVWFTSPTPLLAATQVEQGVDNCNFNNVCDAWESEGSCPDDCTPTPPTCNNNDICESWENPGLCPNDCSRGSVLPPLPSGDYPPEDELGDKDMHKPEDKGMGKPVYGGEEDSGEQLIEEKVLPTPTKKQNQDKEFKDEDLEETETTYKEGKFTEGDDVSFQEQEMINKKESLWMQFFWRVVTIAMFPFAAFVQFTGTF